MEQSAAAAIAVVAAVESRCRLCFSADDLTCPLFHSEGDPSREMIDIILECTSIQITLEDDYPSRVCEKCVETLDKFHHYRRRCLENDRILKSQRSSSAARVRVKQEPQQPDDEPGSPTAQQDQQQVKQEDPGGSSILRSILLQVREAGRAPSTASAEQEAEQDASEQPDHKQEEPAVDEVDAAVAPASLLQQMLLQQQGFSRELNQSPAHAGPSHPGPSPSLLKRMLLEGGGAPSPLEGPSHRHDEQKQSAAQSPQQPPPTNHHQHQQQHDENHNEEHSETPLASQLRAILLQHRAAAAAAAAAAGSAASASTGAATPGEKPEVSYLRSLFLRNDSDGNEDSDSESAVAAAAAVADEPNRELLFSMFQELRARNELNSDDTDDSAEDRAFDYRIPAVRRRSSESTTATTNAESRKRRRLDFTCLLCGRPFLNRSKLVLHMRTHIAPPSESPSGAGASGSGGSSGSVAAAAAAVAAAAAAVAGERNADNNEDDEESRQIELLERRSYACYICGADQNNLQQLKEHLLLAHQDRIRSRGRAKERPKPLISCNFCSRQFRSQFAYGEHLRTHTGERPFPCDQCDKRFPRRFQLLGHLYNVHKQSWVADESKAKFVKK